MGEIVERPYRWAPWAVLGLLVAAKVIELIFTGELRLLLHIGVVLVVGGGAILAYQRWSGQRAAKMERRRSSREVPCASCGYDLREIESRQTNVDGLRLERVVCPECGAAQDVWPTSGD